MDIVTIGEVLIDLTQTGRDERGIPQFAANPGGAPANLAVAAAKLGAQTTFIGKVGEDAFGRYLTEVLQENKVDTRYMVTDADHPTTMAVVSVDAAGDIITFNPRKAYESDAELASFLKVEKEQVFMYTGDFSYQVTEISRYQPHAFLPFS